ncbi:MAG: CPBP family intramembrane metalloprotease [Planctomycetes bacterium]|nr:CPBP family intramembrane metalloprotease [Planctomycetota bacterium]
MPPTEPSIASGPAAPLWLFVVAAACVPVTGLVLVRISRWWESGASLPLPMDEAWAGGALAPAVGVALFFVMMVAMLAIAQGYAAGRRAGLWPWEPLGVPEMLSPGMFLAQALPPLVGLAVVLGFGRGAAATVGIRVGNVRMTVLAGVVAFTAALPVCIVALKVNAVLVALLGEVPREHPLLVTVHETPAAWVMAAALVQAAVLAALAEEFIYRGVLMTSLLPHAGAAGALAITSAVFALVHLPTEPQAVLPLFILALAMGWAAYWTRSLLAPVIAHALFNGLMVVSTFAAR